MYNIFLKNLNNESLTTNEKKILEYIFHHSNEIKNLSIQEFASRINFSTTSVMRFCKKLGFSGYSEFKYNLIEDDLNLKDSKTTDKPVLPILETLDSEIIGTSSLLDCDDFYEIIQFLRSSRPLYLWAPGGLTSSIIAYLESLLFHCGRQNVYKLESSKSAEHVIKFADKNSILLIISASGNFSPSIRLASLAHLQKIDTIAITPFNHNEISQYATHNLHFFTLQRENKGAETTSRLPILYIIHILISYLLKEGSI